MSIYIYDNQQTSGPFEENAVAAWLHAGQLSPEVLACQHGSTQWQPLREIFPAPVQRAASGGAQTPGASPSANVREQPQVGTCEKCGQHEGRVYSFTFGRRGAHIMRRVGHTNIHTVHYAVAGRKYVAACDSCIRRRRVTFLVVFGLMVIVGAGLAFLVVTMNQRHLLSLEIKEVVETIGFIGGILGLIGLRFLLPNIFRSKVTHAENLAIALKKRELRKQGFNTFWNTRNYNKLRQR